MSTSTIPRYEPDAAGDMRESPVGRWVRHDDVAHGSALVATHELARLMDSDRLLAWLLENVAYLEHGPRALGDGYWPHQPTDVDGFPNFYGLTLREYVRARLRGERGVTAPARLALMHADFHEPDRRPRNWQEEQGPRHYAGLDGCPR